MLECLDELDSYSEDLDSWTGSLGELAEIEDAFPVDERGKLAGMKILDIGTDCVKPLYIALKFEPNKIIGINDSLPRFASDLELESKLFVKTTIKFYDCNFFNKETLNVTLRKEKIRKFDIVLLSKTLHHLRAGGCVLHEREEHKNHKCRDDEKCCIYEIEEQEIFKGLLELGKRVIVYECFRPYDEDVDKVRGRGGHFTISEWKKIFDHLSAHYEVKLIKPQKWDLDKMSRKKQEEREKALRKVDCICFYVQAK